jgi:hypothetical protein
MPLVMSMVSREERMVSNELDGSFISCLCVVYFFVFMFFGVDLFVIVII